MQGVALGLGLKPTTYPYGSLVDDIQIEPFVIFGISSPSFIHDLCFGTGN